jgi:hypothetical protein
MMRSLFSWVPVAIAAAGWVSVSSPAGEPQAGPHVQMRDVAEPAGIRFVHQQSPTAEK